MLETDYNLGDLVRLSRTASAYLRSKLKSSAIDQVFLVVEKKEPRPFGPGHPFYYVYSALDGMIGPCFHHELSKISAQEE